jgi:glutaminyl-peptide cyclotransferase
VKTPLPWLIGSFIFFITVVSACGDSQSVKTFDGQLALRYAKEHLSVGPRVPGTIGWQKGGDWIVAQMKKRADTVIEQRWMHKLANGDSIPMRNILARFRPEVKDRVLYITHWDTRPRADQESDTAKQKLPIPGANDGASGVGFFIALADILKEHPPNIGVDLLFVDGEDYGSFTTDTDVLIGSRYFAKHLPSPDYRPMFGIVWDMIGGSNLQIYQEQNSVARAPEVVSRVWMVAKQLGFEKVFIPQAKHWVTDDHIPLLDVGLRIIDVIDLDYPFHHKLSDTEDKLSAKSLGIIGEVARTLIYEM